MNKLFTFQEQSVQKLMTRRHNLLADEMGLGKTIQAIELINRLKLCKVLVICKANIKRNWQAKLKEWLITPRIVQIIDKKTDYISDLSEIVIVNYDLINHSYLKQQLTDHWWDLVICDEAHYLKNRDAKRTLTVLGVKGIVHRANRTLMMTGTPILNRPIELYPMLRVLAPQVMTPYSDYTRYAKRYCGAFNDGFSFNVQGASNIDELNIKLRDHYMIRRLTHEVEVQLPKKRYEIIFIDPTKDIREKLSTIHNATRKDFQHQSLGVSTGQLAILRRTTAEKKLDETIDLIKEYANSCPKLLIFAYHHSIIDRLKEELKEFNPVVLTGSTTQTGRESAIKIFKTVPTAHVFIGQLQAAGEGIDGLQNICHNVLFVEWSWVPGEIEQACKRVHRIGQTKPVLIRFLVWANSIEEHMMRVALDKVKTIKEILK